MEDSTEVELYEEIDGNPAYSSSSDISESDLVSFQIKEPRQTECREEDVFARARPRPDKFATLAPSVGPTLKTSLLDTFAIVMKFAL